MHNDNNSVRTVMVSLSGGKDISVNNSQFSDISSLGFGSSKDLQEDLNIFDNNLVTTLDTDEQNENSGDGKTDSVGNNNSNNSGINIDRNVATTIIPKGGRALDPTWALFTDDVNANLAIQSTCKYCDLLIKHHKKIESVKAHLKKCKSFLNIIENQTNKLKPDFLQSKVTSNSKQVSITKFSVPSLSNEDQSQFNKLLAMYFYTSGTAFFRVENKFLHQALSLLRPTIKVVSRKKLAGGLLKKQLAVTQKQVQKFYNSNDPHGSLTSDGWTDPNDNPRISYCYHSNSITTFMESVNTGETSHSAVNLTLDAERVIDKEQLSRPQAIICGMVTDNTKTNMVMWSKLTIRYPDKYFYGCAAHGLNLVIQKIFGPTKKANGTYTALGELNYPFEELMEFTKGLKDTVNFFNNHQIPKAKLEALQNINKHRRLQSQGKTRWSSLVNTYTTCKQSSGDLWTLTGEETFLICDAKQLLTRTSIKELFRQENIQQQFNKGLCILEPINEYITLFQSDNLPLSDVVLAFKDLWMKIHTLEENNKLNQFEALYIKLLVEKYEKFTISKAHKIAYLLDPRYIGERYDQNELDAIEEILCCQSINNIPILPNSEAHSTLASEFGEYLSYAQKNKSDNNMKYHCLVREVKPTSVRLWWNNISSCPNLKAIAKRIFNLMPSSAAAERSFSEQGFIQGDRRNCLHDDTVEALTYIRANTRALDVNYKPNLHEDDSSWMNNDTLSVDSESSV